MIQLLDCTLRDGGYVNDWKFGEKNIQKIMTGLSASKVDIIECGFITDKPIEKGVQSKFSSVEDLEKIIPPKSASTFVCMINFGEYQADNLPKYTGGKLRGIRIAFHKKDLENAERFALVLKEKGYLVFYQPMVTLNYSDEELKTLFASINRIHPYAAYIVDSFGSMRDSDTASLFEKFDANIDKDIIIGLHAHNNLQLAYSNALLIAKRHGTRDVILDSSVYGMGRGAGNLCTELITSSLNKHYQTSYNALPLLQIIDECLMPIYLFSPWGYSIPYYLSATNDCHPNYASFLMNKQTLSVQEIHKIISSIPSKNRAFYDKNLITELYNNYQSFEYDDLADIKALSEIIAKRNVLLIAPGRSIKAYSDNISSFIKKKQPVVICINFQTDMFDQNFVFIGNAKRLQAIENAPLKEKNIRLITTSNLQYADSLRVNYSSLIDPRSEETDNSGIMCIRLLKKCNVSEVYLAGFDGFDIKNALNFVDTEHVLHIEKQSFTQKTSQIKAQLDKLREEIHISFITPSLYE